MKSWSRMGLTSSVQAVINLAPGDIHGLILYKKNDLEKYLTFDKQHTNAIRVVTPILSEGGLSVQTIAPINNGHDKRPSRKLWHSFPAPVNVLAVMAIL